MARAQGAPEQMPSETGAPAWTGSLEVDLRYVNWSGDRGDSTSVNRKGGGEQLYLPVSLSANGTQGDFKIETLLRTAFVWANQATPTQSGSISTLTDTVLSGTFTDIAIDGVQPFVSLNFNLPTGKTALFGPRAFARMDPDIVDVPAFGEGFNFGVTLGANIPIRENLVATLSGSHIWRGGFTRETPFNPPFPQTTTQMSPGNSESLDGSLSWQGSEWYLQGALSWSHAHTISIDSFPAIRPGDSVSASFSAFYQSSPAWSASADVSWSYAFKNSTDQGNGFMTEPRDSNSNMLSINLTPTWNFNGGNVGPHIGFLYRDHNAYRTVDESFSPAKTRLAAGARVQFALTPAAVLTLSADRIWTNERELLFAPSIPVVAKAAWNVALGTTISF
jgi:hypothetical protein